jgi:tetratricopeptide (TPR) repeat protein
MFPEDDRAAGGGSEAAEAPAEALAEASALAEQGDWPGALDLLLRQERDHPKDPTLLCMLGVAARECGSGEMAYEFFRRCLAQQPEDPALLTTAGAGIAEWDDADAERVLRLAAITAPHVVSARLNYGSYLAREGLFDAAAVELEAARDLDPDSAEVRYELAVAHLLAGRREAGVDHLADALARSEDDDWILSIYGLALAEAGRVDEAAEQLYAASLARSDDWELQIAAALAAAAEEWADHAWDALARAELGEAADPMLIREVEERIELGADAARVFLQEEVASPLLRSRILSRD